MMLLKMLAAIFVLCVVAAVGFYISWLYPTYVVRYRLTVNVFLGSQPHSGSSVVEIQVKRQLQFIADMPPLHSSIIGEATFVDLGGGRNLVATLRPGSNGGLAADDVLFRAFQIPFAAGEVAKLKGLRGERRLGPADWPAFVAFRNVGDALSVEPVDPSALENALGVNARVEGVTLAVTEDPVTHDLEQHLPWLSTPLSNPDLLALARLHSSRGAFIRNDP